MRKMRPKTKRTRATIIAIKTGLLVVQRMLSLAPIPGSGTDVGADDMIFIIQIIINKKQIKQIVLTIQFKTKQCQHNLYKLFFNKQNKYLQKYINQNFFYIIIKSSLFNFFIRKMENIVFDKISTFQEKYGVIRYATFEQATNILTLINHEAKIIDLQYDQNKNILFIVNQTQPLQELKQKNILLCQFLIDCEQVLCVTQNGTIFLVDKQGNVQIKAQNQDGIAAASISPTQQYLYMVTKNNTLIQLDMEFDLVNQIPLDQNQSATSNKPKFSWRPDGNYFALNYQTLNGRKCVTRDKMMSIFLSPSKSDLDPKGPVQSVGQKGRKNMSQHVAWQPNGALLAGSDELDGKHRVIFWQKNGLRHLQFSLLDVVKKVNNLSWSSDSSVLFVECETAQQKRVLYLYYRANYHWYLKNQIILTKTEKYLTFKTKSNKIILAQENQLRVIEFSISLSKNQWISKSQEKISSNAIFYAIDGTEIKINDYGKSLIPPPMSMYTHKVGVIMGASLNKNLILLITQNEVLLYNFTKNQITKKFQRKTSILPDIIVNLHLLSSQIQQSVKFIANSHIYEQEKGIITKKQISLENHTKNRTYQITLDGDEQQQAQLVCQYQNECLTVNNNVLSKQCTSYMFYHQFLIFTVATNDMYDRMFAFNVNLDRWIWSEDSTPANINQKIEQIQTSSKLNCRNVQRGSKIITCRNGRVVFQLPRGNLQGIYPKVIMINEVKNKIQQKLFKEAFEYIRTHKLDFDLLIDLDPEGFITQANQIFININKVDYLNLLVSHLTQGLSKQIYYALTTQKLDQVSKYYDFHLKGKKVKAICEIVSKELRIINKQKYILSIFTSQIKMGLLNQVLFEIKQLKKDDVQEQVPPHIIANKEQKKKPKSLNSQQILQYICWLVDANVIYEAALLTYDLELAAMTARCTQKDPKQYIPYLQSLKIIQNQVEFKKKICLDLKKYDKAIQELAKGNQQQKKEGLSYIQKYKLFKCGLKTFAHQQNELKIVKQFIIDELLILGQSNQAFQFAKSINNYQKALQISIQDMDSKRIKQCLHNMGLNQIQKKQKVKEILENIKDQTKNKADLARLYAYIENYEQAVRNYMKSGGYKKAYQYINKVSKQFIEKQVKEQFKLAYSIKKNLLLKEKNLYLQKFARLLKVHTHKKHQGGQVHSFKQRQNEDMYSQRSVASKSGATSYTMSTTTGLRKKKDKKRNILNRNVKEGSILEEQYLLAFLEDLSEKAQNNIKQTKALVQHLIYMNLIEQAEDLIGEAKQYANVMNKQKAKSFAKHKFQQSHPQAKELYRVQRNTELTIDSFKYLIQ